MPASTLPTATSTPLTAASTPPTAGLPEDQPVVVNDIIQTPAYTVKPSEVPSAIAPEDHREHSINVLNDTTDPSGVETSTAVPMS